MTLYASQIANELLKLIPEDQPAVIQSVRAFATPFFCHGSHSFGSLGNLLSNTAASNTSCTQFFKRYTKEM